MSKDLIQHGGKERMAKNKPLSVTPKVTSSTKNNHKPIVKDFCVFSGDNLDDDFKIVLSPANDEFTEEDKNQIRIICHKYKNIYLSGYPHSRKTRKKIAKSEGRRFAKVDNPGICLTYFLKDGEDNCLEITVLVSDEAKVLDRFPEEKLSIILQHWQQDVVDEIDSSLT